MPPSSTSRASRAPTIVPSGAGLRSRTIRPDHARLRDVPRQGQPGPRRYVRRGQLPRHAGERALSDVRNVARTRFAGTTSRRASTSARRPRRASSSGARSPLRRGDRSTRGASSSSSTSDPNYQALLEWVTAHGPGTPPDLGAAFDFFAHRVQPMLVKKGCMMLQCHSAAMFHDYRLHGGSGGSFSLSATQKNYALTIAQLSLESDDPTASRLVRKNLYRPELLRRRAATRASPTAAGRCSRTSRGRPPTARPATPMKYDYDNDDARHRSRPTASSRSGTSASATRGSSRRSRRSPT